VGVVVVVLQYGTKVHVGDWEHHNVLLRQSNWFAKDLTIHSVLAPYPYGV